MIDVHFSLKPVSSLGFFILIQVTFSLIYDSKWHLNNMRSKEPNSLNTCWGILGATFLNLKLFFLCVSFEER